MIASDKYFDGILYFSTATCTYSKRNYRLYQNLVLPVKEIKNSGYDTKLLREIKLTPPLSANRIKFFKEYEHEYFQKFKFSNGLPENGLIVKNNNSSIHYSASGFRLLELMLEQKECAPIIQE